VVLSPDLNSGSARWRRAGLTFAVSLAVKGVALATLLGSVKLGLDYLGPERFGVWMTVASAAGLLSFANFGVDKGLLNALASAYGRGERGEAAALVATAFWAMAALILPALALFALAYPFIPWAGLFKALTPEAAAETGPAMAVLTVCTALGLLASLVDTVQAAHQEGYLNGLWEAVGKVLGLGFMAGAIAGGGGLPWLVLGLAGAPLLASVANAAFLFGRRRPELRPGFMRVRRDMARRLFGAGGLFFASQIAMTIAYYADNLIVARLYGSEAVASYAVTARLFDFSGMLLLLLGGALWPALAAAIARGDTAWARRSLAHTILASLLLAFASALPLIFAGPKILALWVGEEISPPLSLFPAFGLFWILSAVTQPIFIFLNAANALRFQLACLTALALPGLGLKLVAAHFLGAPGIAWGRLAAEILFLLIPYGLYLRRRKII